MATITTSAMTREQMTAWLQARGVPEGELEDNLAEFAGKTEDEMDETYDTMCGPIA